MKYEVIVGDITQVPADAIVNAAHTSLLGGGGVDGAIHRAAGIELLNECQTLGGCPTGLAKTTKAYKLPAKYVIHAVGPCYNPGRKQQCEKLLASAYKACLDEAINLDVETIAFPAISCGIYHFPWEDAVHIACRSIYDYRGIPNGMCDGGPMPLSEFLDKVMFVVSNEEIADLYRKEIDLIKEEESEWKHFLKLLKEKPESFDLTKIEHILEKYRRFATRDDDEALFTAINNKTSQNIELVKMLVKFGSNLNVRGLNASFIPVPLVEFVRGADENSLKMREFLMKSTQNHKRKTTAEYLEDLMPSFLCKKSYNLERFTDAQDGIFDTALEEIRNGYKASPWMWFIFPQLKGLGFSEMSQYYGISGLAETKDYLKHPILGERLRKITVELLQHKDVSAEEIFGPVDALKLKSCMTLFDLVAPNDTFKEVLDVFFSGQTDDKTKTLLRAI